MSSSKVEPSISTTVSGEARPWQRLIPWMAGSGMAMGQAVLATACSLPTVGKCVGCGSCVVGVATLYGWAMKHKQAGRQRIQQGLEPFEIRTAELAGDGDA